MSMDHVVMTVFEYISNDLSLFTQKTNYHSCSSWLLSGPSLVVSRHRSPSPFITRRCRLSLVVPICPSPSLFIFRRRYLRGIIYLSLGPTLHRPRAVAALWSSPAIQPYNVHSLLWFMFPFTDNTAHIPLYGYIFDVDTHSYVHPDSFLLFSDVLLTFFSHDITLPLFLLIHYSHDPTFHLLIIPTFLLAFVLPSDQITQSSDSYW